MIRSGYGRECVNIYQLIRKLIVEGLYHLGVEQYSSSQINKMSSEVSEDTIKNWLNATQTAVKTLFHSEISMRSRVFCIRNSQREMFHYYIERRSHQFIQIPRTSHKEKESTRENFPVNGLV